MKTKQIELCNIPNWLKELYNEISKNIGYVGAKEEMYEVTIKALKRGEIDFEKLKRTFLIRTLKLLREDINRPHNNEFLKLVDQLMLGQGTNVQLADIKLSGVVEKEPAIVFIVQALKAAYLGFTSNEGNIHPLILKEFAYNVAKAHTFYEREENYHSSFPMRGFEMMRVMLKIMHEQNEIL